MGLPIEFSNDVTNAKEDARGSDGRLNVSSRSDERSYYVSRDQSLAFSLTWQDASTATGDYVVYWKNDDTNGRHFVVDAIGINAQYASDWELWTVSGTAAGGVAATPFCLNNAKPLVASATARTADSSTVSGLTEIARIDIVTCGARSHEELRLSDRLRIGPGQAIALKCDLTDTSPGKTHGIVYGFYE